MKQQSANLRVSDRLGWSVTCLGTGFMTNVPQFYASRLLTGLFESGMYPALAITLTYVYLHNQIHRLTDIAQDFLHSSRASPQIRISIPLRRTFRPLGRSLRLCTAKTGRDAWHSGLVRSFLILIITPTDIIQGDGCS
jgi:hypothetical protein